MNRFFLIYIFTDFWITKSIAACLISTLCVADSQAAGFAVLEQTVQGLGVAYAGTTAGGEDISTIFYNPAGLSEYTGTEIISGGHLVLSNAQFNVTGSSDILNQPLGEKESVKVNEQTLIPNLYFATDLMESFRLGLGVTVPFGLGTRFPTKWQGRYEAIDSELQSLDINPVISYQVNDKFSLGFGVSAQYVKVELSRAIDFGMLCFAQFGAAACSGLALLPQGSDGKVELTGNGWNWGYNFGLLFKPLDNVRIGLAYRSEIHHSVSGKAEFQVPGNAKIFTAAGAFRNTSITAESRVPANLSLGAVYRAGPQLALLFDLNWTEWKQVDKLSVQFENPSQPATTLTFDFKNAVRTSLGWIYDINQAWSVRSGFTFDESPVKDSRTRTFQVPDSDRYWLAAGLNCHPYSNTSFNFSYAHVFLNDAPIAREDVYGHRIQGRFESQIDLFSAELRISF